MTTTVNKVNDFLEAFPSKIIKHTGQPDCEMLNNIKTAPKRNFATVLCTLSGGAHGYFGAILTAAEYAAATPDTIYIKNQVFRLLRYYSPAPRNIARSDWATQNITHNMTSSIT